MSTDLLTDLAEYGHYHREVQQPVRPVEAAQHALTPALAPARPNYTMRRAAAALVAAVLVILLISIPALLRGPESVGPADSVANTMALDPPTTGGTVDSPSTASATPELQGGPDGFTMLHTLADTSLIALSQMNVWRSTNNGETWEEWYAQDHEIDLLAVARDGAVIAVRNPNETSESPGTGTSVNGTPEVHRLDPASGTWSVIPLPRPAMPAPDLAPQPEDIEQCGLYGLSSWVDGSAVAAGEQIVILGDQRVVANGICDEDFQFLWTSSDGLEWDLEPEIGVDGYLTGIIWRGDQLVGYGSSRPSYVGPGSPEPQVWTTTDLGSWTEQSLDLLTLPEGSIVQYWPEIVDDPAGLSLIFPVERYRPGLDNSISDVEALRQWRLDAGLPESPTDELSLEESLELDGVDFPLEADELTLLNNFYDVRESLGTLTLTTADGSDWESVYAP